MVVRTQQPHVAHAGGAPISISDQMCGVQDLDHVRSAVVAVVRVVAKCQPAQLVLVLAGAGDALDVPPLDLGIFGRGTISQFSGAGQAVAEHQGWVRAGSRRPPLVPGALGAR